MKLDNGRTRDRPGDVEANDSQENDLCNNRSRLFGNRFTADDEVETARKDGKN